MRINPDEAFQLLVVESTMSGFQVLSNVGNVIESSLTNTTFKRPFSSVNATMSCNLVGPVKPSAANIAIVAFPSPHRRFVRTLQRLWIYWQFFLDVNLSIVRSQWVYAAEAPATTLARVRLFPGVNDMVPPKGLPSFKPHQAVLASEFAQSSKTVVVLKNVFSRHIFSLGIYFLFKSIFMSDEQTAYADWDDRFEQIFESNNGKRAAYHQNEPSPCDVLAQISLNTFSHKCRSKTEP